jgi:hypothetical protein
MMRIERQEACGVEYTSKLQRMFTDINLSNDMHVAFNTYLTAQNTKLGVDFHAIAMTAGAWPLSSSTPDLHLPASMAECLMEFGSFYSRQHNGRKLTWLHHLSRGELKCIGFDKRYEINMSTHQLVAMVQFNDADRLGMSDLSARTGLSIPDLVRSIQVRK